MSARTRIPLNHFAIRATDTVVELWSGYRIQFGGMERHAFQKDAKTQLKAALTQLLITPNSAFSGYYDSTDPQPADTENSLFTNLLEAMPTGVRFLRFEQGPSRPPQPPTPVDLIGNHLYYYRYQEGGHWITWETDRILARWSRLPRRVPSDGSARPAWFALRQAHAQGRVALTGEQLDPHTNFGLRLIIHATSSGPRNAISNSESVVDGTIAAFHNDQYSDSVFSALTLKLANVPLEELRRALNSPVGPLFDTPAIREKAGYLQISPADEFCRAGELVIRDDSRGRWPELSGELFTIRPARSDLVSGH
jgi:hypothetical protein